MSDWSELTDWWLEESREPRYREEVGPLFRDVFRAEPGDVVLDLGCGDGRILDLVAGMGATTIGVDLNLELARIASARHPVFLNRLPDLACVKDESVDGAYLVLTIEHLEDSGTVFEETARVVRPSGCLTVVVNHPVYTAPGSGPVIDPTDREVFWRFGRYLSRGRSVEPAGDRTVEFHHRPVGVLLTAAAAAGWNLEEVREQGVVPETAARDHLLGRHGDIPHLMALRWRRSAKRNPARSAGVLAERAGSD